MAFIPEEELNQIRQQANIVDIIGRYLHVHRKGKDFAAICPFHDDHDPSLTISPDKQIYKCFVCGAGGNVFTFVQNYENISFPEAVKKVAELSGYHLSVDIDVKQPAKDPHKEKLYAIMNETIQFSMYQLDTPQGINFKEYLDKRGMNKQTREKFQIGYNPDGDSLVHFLTAKGYDTSDLVNCNVVRTSSSGLHDVFSGRIMFPIHDVKGNPIGFSARSIDPSNPSKYINTTDTDLFHKSDIVYNAHRATMSARREGRILVTEGVTDVIAFSKAGVDNVVCTLGTSCTKEQIEILRSLSRKVVFCYDGDRAGQAATYRAGKMALNAGCDVAIIENKSQLDPDEILRKQGEEALVEFSKKEISWMEFVLGYLKQRYNLNNYNEKKEFAKKAMQEVNELDEQIDRDYFTKVISEMTGFELQAQNQDVEVIKTHKVVQNRLKNGIISAEELILSLMLGYPSACQQFEKTLGYLTDPVRNGVAMLIVDARRKEDSFDISALIDKCESKEQKDLIAKLVTSKEFEMPYDQDVFDGAIRKVLISVKTSQADALKEQLRMPTNTQCREIILNEYLSCLMDLRRYIDEENNS